MLNEDKGTRAFEVVDGLPHLLGTKCAMCGAAFFPPRFVCPTCLTDEKMEQWRLGNTGTLYAYTVIRIASKEFNPPYPFGYIIVEPEKVRVPAMITGVEDYSTLKVGMKMQMIVEKLRDDGVGGEIVTYKFKPADNQQGFRETMA
ncbi:MAG: transcriptional regulator [Rhodocyclaceae bacterium]|nr:MAG: transcriptional regulator [Rhodocyclaceae bacterium]